MTIRNRLITLLGSTLLLVNAAQAALPVPAPPSIAGSGYLLLDMQSGKALAASNADQRLEPASLTKIMTAYAVFRELKGGNLALTDQVLVSEKAWKTPGSRMFIEVGKQVSIDELLHGLVIQSGNDAAVALAEHVAGSEEVFAQLMNKHAERLSMSNTHFVNATGLPHADHYTTPADIALVTAATINEFPELYKLYAVKEYTFNNIRQHNRNKLLWRDDSVDGVKTGHTESAGYCLVSSAMRDNMRLIAVVMGTSGEDARARESQSLLNYGFRFYESHRLYGAGDTLTQSRIWKGEREQLPLGIAEDLYVTIPRGQYKNLKARTDLKNPIIAPITRGQPLGQVVIELEGETIAEVPLVALDAIDEGGMISSLMDTVLLMFE